MIKIGSEDRIIDNLSSTLETWDGKLTEIWRFISTTPKELKGGGVWNVIVNIDDALQAIGYVPLVLFFVMGVVETCGSLTELKGPGMAFKCSIRSTLAQATVMYGMELMTALFHIAQGMASIIMDSSGLADLNATTLPDKMVTTIKSVGLIKSIPLQAITLSGPLFIWVLTLVMILTIYSRFFKLYIATVITLVPLASFAGQSSNNIGVTLLKSYTTVYLEGCVIILTCVIFFAFASTPPVTTDSSLALATIVWNYVGELIFNILVLVGTIKTNDRLTRGLVGL